MRESQYVIDDRETPRFRVRRSTMVDPDILAAERREIFDRSWLYVGHESEIPQPHDFRTRSVGGRPVIFTRHTDGTVQVLVNSCSHRGMEIETRPAGHGRFLKCFYHGWSYNTEGTLVALPDEAAYGDNFDRQNLCLSRPVGVESYRGFVFLCWNDIGTDLETYLAGATDVIDLFADQSESGMHVIGGTHLYAARANWKLLSENSYDGYHALTTHHRYLAMLKESGKDLGAVFRSGGGTPSLAWDLGHGHAFIGGSDGSGGNNTGLGRDLAADALVKQVARRDRFAELYGSDWADRMFSGRNVVIFPNLAIVDLIMGIMIRTYYPISPDYMEISAWSLQPTDDEPELRQMRQENFLTFWGPAGLATPDDIEALERCQRGFVGHDRAPWNDISRGMVRERPIFNDELQMRVFWREWDRRINGVEHLAEVPVTVRSGRVALPYTRDAMTSIQPEAAPEPVSYGPVPLRLEVEDFLAYDAALLDEWRLDEWLQLFTPDCRYLVPATDRPDGDPETDLFLIRDDWFLLSQRVGAIMDGTAWAESPRATTHRMISNVRVREEADRSVVVHANFLIHRSRRGRTDSYPGRYEMRLGRGGRAGFEIMFRRAVLSLEELRPQGRVSIIL